MKEYNVWNKWDPLKTVMLGDTYSAEFFSDIKNNKIKSALQQIADETQEDLEGYSNILKDFGCEVIRPELDLNDNIMNYINEDSGKISTVPRSPLQPRDAQLVTGNKLIVTCPDHLSIIEALKKYNSTDVVDVRTSASPKEYKVLKERYDTGQWPTVAQFIDNMYDQSYFPADVWVHIKSNFGANSVTIIGNDLYVDKQVELMSASSINKFRNMPYINENFTVNSLNIGGHIDGCFNVLKPGVIMSLKNIQNYEKTFPDWDVCYLKEQSWAKVRPFNKLKQKNNGSWWVPGQEDNDEFTHFVQTWLQDWVGYVEETVFDVNMLVLDEHHVCVSQMDNPIANAFFKKHNIEPIYVPWRHRFFWDGGLHCITLDLYREGIQHDYFPDRTECVVCEGYI